MTISLTRRRALGAIGAAVFVAGCGGGAAGPQTGPVARGPGIYRIGASERDQVKFRMLDSVNALRAARAAPPLQFSAELNAAAATHSRDMANQNRPWHFGSDGSSPIDRLRRAGYRGTLVGEAISETFESEIETLTAWTEDPGTNGVILDPSARDMGFAWFQERGGKIWWTLVTGQPGSSSQVAFAPAVGGAQPIQIN